MDQQSQFRRFITVVAVIVLGWILWTTFIRDIVTKPDHPPGPVIPVQTPLDDFRQAWTAEDAARWPVTLHLARLSLAAYDELPAVEGTASALNLDGVKRFASRSMVVYVAWARDVMVVTFRGSDDIEDWIVNLNALRPEATDQGGMHAGFSQAYATLKDDIRQLVREHDPKYVWTTGHSLGGALAVVCALDLRTVNADYPTGVMTFGQPMVATVALANNAHGFLADRFVHFANRQDPVPRVPPLAFRHFGSLAMFTGVGVERRWDVYWAKPGDQPTQQPSAERSDIPPMPPAELEQLKARIRAEKVAPRAPEAGPARWTTPSLAAHAMPLYLDNVRRFVVGAGANPPVGASLPVGGEPVPGGK